VVVNPGSLGRNRSYAKVTVFPASGLEDQLALGLPKSLTGVFQGLLLFTLLACDTLMHYRIRRVAREGGH